MCMRLGGDRWRGGRFACTPDSVFICSGVVQWLEHASSGAEVEPRDNIRATIRRGTYRG